MALRRDKLHGLTGLDLLIVMASEAEDAGLPGSPVISRIAQDLALNDSMRDPANLEAYQATLMFVIMRAMVKAREAKSEQALFEVAGYAGYLCTYAALVFEGMRPGSDLTSDDSA